MSFMYILSVVDFLFCICFHTGFGMGFSRVHTDVYQGVHCIYFATKGKEGTSVVWGIYTNWVSVWGNSYLCTCQCLQSV